MGRCLGIDFGTKRIGLAGCDPDGLLASPLETIDGSAPRKAAHRIAEICREREIQTIVIGWPVNMDGSEGAMTQAVSAFEQRLKKHLTIPIVHVDERLTSESAEDLLREAGVPRHKRPAIIDQLAAQVILQDYLDATGPAPTDS